MSPLLFAQTFPDLKFRHFNAANGFPAKYVQLLKKDSQNLLWIGTNGYGLVRYDGKNFKQFTEKANSKSVAINNAYHILEDSSHNFWLVDGKGLRYFNRKKEQITAITYQLPQQALDPSEDFCMPLYLDNQHRLWFYSAHNQKLLTYSLLNKKIEIKVSEVNFCNERNTFYPNKLYQAVQFMVSTQRKSGFRIIRFKNGEINSHKDYFEKGNPAYPEASIERVLVIQDPEHLWLNSNLGLIAFNSLTEKFKIYNRYKGRDIGTISCIAALDSRYLLVSSKSNGLYVFDRNTLEFIQNIRHLDSDIESIQSNSIAELACDSLKNIFVAYLGGGLDIASFPSEQFGQYISRQSSEQFGTNNHFRFIQEIQKGVFWCVNSENKLLEWHQANNFLSETETLSGLNAMIKGSQINQILLDKEKNTWILTNLAIYFKSAPSNHFQQIYTSKDIVNMVQLAKNDYLFSTFSNLYFLQYNQSRWKVREAKEAVAISNEHKIILRVLSDLHFDSTQNMVYVKCEWGQLIWQLKLKNDRLETTKTSEWNNEPSVDPAILLPQKNALLFTTVAGLRLFDNEKNIFQKCGTGILANRELTSLIAYDEQTYFALSNNKLIKINAQNWESTIVELPISGTSKENLIYNSIFCGSDHFIYFATNNGILRFNPKQTFQKTKAPALFISSILVDGQEDSLADAPNLIKKIDIPPDASSLDFSISNTNFEQGNSLNNLQYLIKGLEKSPQPIDENGKIHLNKLPSGNYNFLILSSLDNKVLKSIQLIVHPHWYQTNLFILSYVSLILILGVVLYYLRINGIRADLKLKSEYENKMIHLEMQNLRSQMNPHFIFNSLNSINSFVVQNKTHLASDYLTKFSRLIRLILDNSRNESISLEKEIETLKLYLLMESIRFEKKFEYSLSVDENIDAQTIKVPPMIIQPFVENSIWHGLLHKADRGKVMIQIEQKGNLLLINIEDNGIGRQKSSELNSKNSNTRKSYGMEITTERIKYLNINNKINTVDLLDNENNSAGTKVILSIVI